MPTNRSNEATRTLLVHIETQGSITYLTRRVQRRLRELGWTVQDLVRRTGYNRTFLSKILRRDYIETTDLKRLEAALGVTRDYWGEPLPAPPQTDPEKIRRDILSRTRARSREKGSESLT